MGTKLKPGNYDCYKKAMPDEPMFVLLARDVKAAAFVRLWAELNSPEGDEVSHKASEAFSCAEEMVRWRRVNLCAHGKAPNAYCQPCGRVHGSDG